MSNELSISQGTTKLWSWLRQSLRAIRGRAKVIAVLQVVSIRVMALAGNVGAGLLTAAFLGPTGRGEQTAVGVTALVLGSASALGLHASLIYNLRADPDSGPRYFGSALLLILGASLVGMGIGYVVVPFGLTHYDARAIRFARLLLISVPVGVLTPLFMGVLEANGHFRVAARVLYFQSFGTLTILVACAALGWMTPFSAASAYFIPLLPSFLYVLIRARRIMRPRLTLASPYPQRLLRFGLRFYGVDILSVLSGYLDQMIIVYLLAPAAVGAYAIALSLSRILLVAQGAVATVLFPSIAGREPDRVVEMVARAVRVTTIVNGIAACMIAAVGPSLLLLMYGTRFSSAILPFMILLGEAVVSSAARTLAQAFSGIGRPSVVTGCEVAGVSAAFASMLVLVPAYGIVGAACGSLLGGFVRLFCVLASFRKVLGVALPRLVISRADMAWVAGR